MFYFAHYIKQDNAGKTTILYRLQVGEVVSTIPSEMTFNFSSIFGMHVTAL
jgi:hypothetical protein